MNKITFETTDGEGYGIELEIPSKYEVCPRCEGRGKHTNPSIDGNGLPQECVEDPDFMEDYLSGLYGVRCGECGGKRVIAVPDRERADKETLLLYDRHMKELAECDAIYEAERRMGA